MSKKNKSEINLANLFPSTKNTLGAIGKTGVMDMDTLFPQNTISDIIVDTDMLIYNIKKQRQKSDAYYKKICKACLDAIKLASCSGHTEIEYSVPIHATDYVEYKIDTCLFYIESTLNKHSIRTHKIKCKHNNTIYISWGDLEDDLFANGQKIIY
jgi:hypothetical protein